MGFKFVSIIQMYQEAKKNKTNVPFFRFAAELFVGGNNIKLYHLLHLH